MAENLPHNNSTNMHLHFEHYEKLDLKHWNINKKCAITRLIFLQMQTSRCTCTSRYNEKSESPSDAPVIYIPRPLREGEWRGFKLFKIQSPPKSSALRAEFVVKSGLLTVVDNNK